MEGFQITNKRYFDEYMSLIGREIKSLVKNFDFNYKSLDLGYQTQASAVYSSNIEGNTIDLNSFMNFKLSNEKFRLGKEIKEIERNKTASKIFLLYFVPHLMRFLIPEIFLEGFPLLDR
jgi:predicted transcriptional regulator with HTH domain